MPKPLRVLFLIDSLTMGGAERITVALLPHFDRQRVIPMVCTLSKKGESFLAERLEDVPRFDLESSRLLDVGAFRRFERLVKSEKIDLIHAQLQYATIFSALVRPFTGVPMVITRHILADYTDNWRWLVRNRIEHWCARYAAARVITVSEAARIFYAELAHIPLERIQTIYNGVDLDKFAPVADKRANRRELGLPAEGALVTMVGVMRPGKGQDVAIDAFRQISDAHLLLVGDGYLRSTLEQQAGDLKDRVHFLGERMDVPDILKASDILILPSDSEALPTVLIEAGAAALPAVASDVGGCAEIVVDGETGRIIPRRDPEALARAVQQLVAEPETMRRMGQKAYERVYKLFTLPGQAEALTSLYEAVAAAKKGEQSV